MSKTLTHALTAITLACVSLSHTAPAHAQFGSLKKTLEKKAEKEAKKEIDKQLGQTSSTTSSTNRGPRVAKTVKA